MKTQLKFLILSLSFITSFVFGASNTPNVSISPTSVSILEGTTSVDLNVTLSPAPNQKYMDIVYSDQCNVAESTIQIAKNTSIGTITIPTSGLAAHTSCNIVLKSATGGPAQNDGIITVSTATITITAVDDPTASDKSYTTIYNTDLTGNVITDTPADSDPNSHPLTIASNTSPSHGSVNLSGDGGFTYSPTANYSGMDSFDYTITNSNGGLATATVTIEVFPPQADLGISKSGPASIDTGTSFSYGLTIQSATGNGMTDAQNIKVTDTLPSGMTYNGVNQGNFSCIFSTGTLTCLKSSMSPGGSETITINVTAPVSAGLITNTANIASDTTDPVPGNNSSSVQTNVNSSNVNMSITKVGTPSPANTSSTITYTIQAQNLGTSDASTVLITDDLPDNLQYISVDGGNDWSCSQGQTILCSYIGNNGVFEGGATVDPIILKATSPASDDTVVNTAFIESGESDSDISDNNDTSTIQVSFNTTPSTGGRDFDKFLQYNVFGDMKLIGNVNIWKQGTSEPGQSDNNNNFTMLFADADSDHQTFNSSWAELDLGDPKYEVVWAGLYWLGHICTNDYSSCDNSNNGGYNTAQRDKGEVLFRYGNSGSYTTIKANNLDVTTDSGGDQTLYGGFADVTDFVKDPNRGQGRYYLANLRTSEGRMSRWGGFGGWALQVIYRDPDNGMAYKSISVFNGFQQVNSGNAGVGIDPVEGFLTPQSGTVNASIGFFVGDGDAGSISGDHLEMYNANTNSMQRLTDPLNADSGTKPAGGGIFNGSMTELGTYSIVNNPRSNPHVNNLGIDIDRIDASAFMKNSQSSTKFRFIAGSDIHTINLISFATDLTTPIIDNFTKSAEIIDENGASRPAGPNEAIYPGDELLYTLVFTNTGDEKAELVEIFDDFDFDGLTPALDLDNFDASKTRLYEGSDASGTEVTNDSGYDCGYDSGQKRVYCRLDEVAIDETFTMQFSVTVKDPMNTNQIDKNATNTAYSMYKNPNGDSYVILKSSPEGGVGGDSNSFNAGVFTTHGSSIGSMISLDAINNLYDYNADKNITTKIVNEPFSIQLVHLDINGNYSGYEAWQGTRPMNVVLTLCNDISGELLNDPANTAFTQGVSEIIVPNILLEKAHRNDRIKMGYIDWNAVLTWPDSDSQCVTNSQDAANLNNVPQCFNSWLHAEDVFPEEEYPYVKNTCYGEGLNSTVPSDKLAACDSNAYSHNGDVASTDIYPVKYQHRLGCYHCLTDAFSEFSKCSTDNFAARPKDFDLTMTDPAFPNYLRSAKDYNVTLIARDGLDNPTVDYNLTATDAQHGLDLNKTMYFADGTIDNTGVLHGEGVFTPSDFYVADGVSVSSSTSSNEVVGIKFTDVGDVALRIEDQNWANVDADDTPQNCTDTTNASDITIEAPAYICGEINATFIVNHFTLSGVNISDHDQRLTYLTYNSDLNMSAPMQLTIEARNADGNITENFRRGALFYENPVEINITVPLNDSNGTAISLETLKHDIPTPLLLGFGGVNTSGAIDQNGTHTITWSKDENETQKLLFNYNKVLNVPKNPFDVNGSDINVSVKTTYTPSSFTADGNSTSGGDATFYYAKIKSSEYFYKNVATLTKETPITISIYCDLPAASCGLYGINTATGAGGGATDEAEWFLSLGHKRSNGDGAIGLKIQAPPLIEGAGAPTIDGKVNPNGADINITDSNGEKNATVGSGVGPSFPITVGIEIVPKGTPFAPPYTDGWLVHNPDDPIMYPTPFYKVRFIGPDADWSGVGVTGHAMDINISAPPTRGRMDW